MSTTSAPSSSPTPRLPRILSWITGIIGIVMIIAGIAIYVGTSAELRAQHIDVAAVTAANPGKDAGKPLAGPFTALAQIEAINVHVGEATSAVNNGVGLKFGQMHQVASSNGVTYNADVTAKTTTDGQIHQAGDPLSATDAAYFAARATAQQGAWTQASLLDSELAFGIAVLVMGLGVITIIISVAQLSSQAGVAKAVTASRS